MSDEEFWEIVEKYDIDWDVSYPEIDKGEYSDPFHYDDYFPGGNSCRSMYDF